MTRHHTKCVIGPAGTAPLRHLNGSSRPLDSDASPLGTNVRQTPALLRSSDPMQARRGEGEAAPRVPGVAAQRPRLIGRKRLDQRPPDPNTTTSIGARSPLRTCREAERLLNRLRSDQPPTSDQRNAPEAERVGGANGGSRSIFRSPGAAQHIGVQLEAARWRAAARADGRDDRGGDHRRKRRVRAQHEDPRSPDHRVRQETRDARIQAVIARSPASSAYAIPCGTNNVTSTSPATTSWESQERR